MYVQKKRSIKKRYTWKKKQSKHKNTRDEKGTKHGKKATMRTTITATIFNVETKNDNNTLINKRNNHTRFELTANHQTPKQYRTH